MAGKIVIVDDDPDDVLLLAADLKRHGYSVAVLDDAEDALEYVRLRPPDLLILDILLPRMDGTELCRSLRAHPATRDVPVIFLTGLKRHYESGGVPGEQEEAVFAKPMNSGDLEAFRAAIRKAMSGGRP